MFSGLPGKTKTALKTLGEPTKLTTMKHNHNHDNAPSAGLQLGLQPVRFEFTHPTATTVCIAGTFNNWQPEAKPMHPFGNGCWMKETNLAPGTYEYCLVVDGKYMPDPLIRETVANPFGGRNSVLKVCASPEASHLISAELSPLKKASKSKT